MPAHPDRPLVLVSNRGPVSFRLDDDGSLVARRGAGGLVSGLAPLVSGTGVTWIAAAMSDGDRAAAERGPVDAEGFRTHLLAIDPERFRMAYDVIGNATLWFLHHHLWDVSRRPRFDHRFREAWAAYRAVNRTFADAVVADAPAGAAVLLQDYHLSLVAPVVREQRPDLALVHFAHTPFANPDVCAILPDDVRHELFTGLAANHACGFHTARWADTFLASARAGDAVRPPHTFVAPLSSDPDDLAATAALPVTVDARADIARRVGGRRLIVRVDRIELSKNLVRGFLAFELLLEEHPEWIDRVVFGAFVYPTREGLPEYLAYRQEVEQTVRRINERFGTEDWTPILYDGGDDYPRSVAALQSYDVLFVNPIRDGLNLVAKEGPLLNDNDGVLLLSSEAGAWSELGDEAGVRAGLDGAALLVHPYDLVQNVEQLHRALSMDPGERARFAGAVRALASTRTPADWLAEQLAAADA